jgi:hypothetical protein
MIVELQLVDQHERWSTLCGSPLHPGDDSDDSVQAHYANPDPGEHDQPHSATTKTTATLRHLAMPTGHLWPATKASNQRLDQPRSLMDDPQ